MFNHKKNSTKKLFDYSNFEFKNILKQSVWTLWD